MFTTNNLNIETLLQNVDSYIAELKILNPVKDSHKWYLLNNLMQYHQSLVTAKSKQDVENAASIFSRFCTESMDWDTKDYQNYIQLSEEGYKLAKTFNEKFQNQKTF